MPQSVQTAAQSSDQPPAASVAAQAARSAVELFVRDPQPPRPLVVEVRERALLEARIPGGQGQDGRTANQRADVGVHVGKVVHRTHLRRHLLDPLRRIQPTLAAVESRRYDSLLASRTV